MSDDSRADSSAEDRSSEPIDVGDRYRLTDDGTVFEVVGFADGAVDVIQYDGAGERVGEHTTSIEEFRREVVAPAQ